MQVQQFSPRYAEAEGQEEEGGNNSSRLLADRLDCLSVQSEPIRGGAQATTPAPTAANPVPMPQQQQQAALPVDKRDSLSDSGAEGSGTNTPTRGRTVTEGLLRFVQDSSLAKPLPERKVRQVEGLLSLSFASFVDPDSVGSGIFSWIRIRNNCSGS